MASKTRDHITYDKVSHRFQARYMVTLVDGTRKRQSVYGRTYEEVKEKYDRIVAENILGTPLQTSNTTLEQYLTMWVESAKKIRGNTREGYRGEIRKYIIPNIGKVKLSCLTTPKIQNMINKIQREGASVRTTQIVKSILSKALKPAEAQGLVKRGIVYYVELDTYRPKEREVWTEEEGKAFLEAIKNHKYRLFFLMYMTYGLRRGEPIPLTWGDIDFEEKTISINKQYTYQGKELVVCPPKTDKSIRILPLLPHIEEELLKIKDNSNPPSSAPIVADGEGLIKPSSVDYEFEKVIKQNHFRPVVLHSLRHFVATMLGNYKVAPKDAQMILGHSTPLVTMQFYQHSNTESKRKALSIYAEEMQF